jgi:hypothetical protein
LTLCAVLGCGGEISNDVAPIAYRTAKHVGGGDASILTITEFLGPQGAAPGRVYPGRYVIKGTFDLTNARKDSGKVTFGFLGEASVNREKCITDFQVPAGQRQGAFELTMFITRWRGGAGIPLIDFVSGSDALDSIELH